MSDVPARQLPVQLAVEVPANSTRKYRYSTGGTAFINLVEFLNPTGSFGNVEAYLKFEPTGSDSAFRMPRRFDDGGDDVDGDTVLSDPESYPIPVGLSPGASRFITMVEIDGVVEVGLKNTTSAAETVVARSGAAADEETALGLKTEG